MKILHINFSFTQGGIDNMMNDIMLAQKMRGQDMYLLIVNDHVEKEVLELIPKGVKTYFIQRPKGSKNPFYFIKTILIVIFLIHPDIIHSHNSKLGKICNIIRNATHCKSILTVHDMQYDTSQYHYFDYIVAISQSVKADILKTFNRGNIGVIYNGIDFNKIKSQVIPTRNTPFRIIIVSRLDVVKKGHDTLLKALSLLNNKGVSVRLDIIGDGLGLDYIKELIEEFGLCNIVSILGSKSRQWVYTNLYKYDLLVQPSRYEGFGLTIVEGIAAKIPILVSDIDGPNEITCNGSYGWMFRVDDYQDMAEKLMEIYNMGPNTLHSKINKSYQYMKKHYSVETTANNYLELYHMLNKKKCIKGNES